MPFCSKCGTEVPADINFCAKCGNSMQGAQSASDSASPAIQKPSAGNAPGQAPGQRKPWVPIAAGAVSLLILLAIIISLKGPSPRAKASNVAWWAETWKKMQSSYILERNKTGNCQQIGYAIPQKGASQFAEHFAFDCGVLANGIAYWAATSNEDLGDCKAGNKWGVYMDYKSGIKIELPDEECLKLTPKFSELGPAFKRGEPQSAAPEAEEKPEASAGDAKGATAELEREAKKWQKNSASYKSNEGKQFSFKSGKYKDAAGNVYEGMFTWTATSKAKIGDCPAKSVWEMSISDEECGALNKAPAKCKAITPKAITNWTCSGEEG